MSQTFENCVRSFFIRCADVGLDCNDVMFGFSEENVIDNTFTHMFEYHAIIPQEMTACMKLKIEGNVHMRITGVLFNSSKA